MSMKAGGNRSKPGGGNTTGAAASGSVGGSGGGRQNLGRSVHLNKYNKTQVKRIRQKWCCNCLVL